MKLIKEDKTMKDLAIRYVPNFYNDIPLPYAVFEVLLNSKKNEVKDAIFVFVNDSFAKAVKMDSKDIIGKSFLDIFKLADNKWKNEFFKSAILRKESQNYIFSLDLGYWISYSGAPCLDLGYCSYVFFNIDLETKDLNKQFMSDDILVRIAKLLNSDSPFDLAMKQVLKELLIKTDSDRVYILEADGAYVEKYYESLKDGIKSTLEKLKKIPISRLENGWIL